MPKETLKLRIQTLRYSINLHDDIRLRKTLIAWAFRTLGLTAAEDTTLRLSEIRKRGYTQPIFWPDLRFRENELKVLLFLAKSLFSAFHCLFMEIKTLEQNVPRQIGDTNNAT